MKHNKTRNSGFTLLETLLAVAILVILLGLSLVGVARYKDHLKIAELDNAARDIYMAAENRAVLLQNSGRLGTPSAALLSSTGSETVDSKNVRILSNTTASGTLDELLPVGSIDPALREKYFRVVYDEATGHVVEVFYAEKEIDSDLTLFRGKTRSERINVFRGGKSLVGYYGGEAAPPIGTKPLPTPGVEVFITNGDELTLTVRYTMPSDGLPVDEFGFLAVTFVPNVVLTYGDDVGLLKTEKIGDAYVSQFPKGRDRLPAGSSPNISGIKPGGFVEYTWVLDSLEQKQQKDAEGNLVFDAEGNPIYTTEYAKQFKDLNSLTDLGGDFTVKASLKLTAPGCIESAYYATGTDNSLFAKGSTYGTGGIAKLANLRHLQNLCAAHSTVGEGTVKAEQLCNIDCEASKKNGWETATEEEKHNYVLNPNYNFVPIVNSKLQVYDGKDKNISSLYTSHTGEDVGLFGKVTTSLTIQNCRVLWNDSDAGKLVTDTDPKAIVYKVSGENAGGLVGSVSGTVNITNSFAATVVKGTSTAGGLVGSASGTVNIISSYGDCYLNGSENAGGLVGSNSSSVTLTNAYAAGFIVDPENDKTAGLVFGTGTTTAENVYSVVRVLDTADSSLAKPAKPLYGDMGESKTGNVRYLSRKDEAETNVFGGKFITNPETHVYNLQYKLKPDNPTLHLDPPYPFPSLNGLPHYCDWAELEDTPAGLVYYEQYSNSTDCGIDYGQDGTGKTISGSNLPSDLATPKVAKDGYGLVFETLPEGAYTVTYGDGENKQAWTLKKTTTEAWTWTKAGDSAPTQTVTPLMDNKMIPLPDAIVTGELPKQTDVSGNNITKFYQKLVCGSNTYYFNPHFARSVVAPMKDEDGTVTQLTSAPNEPTVTNVNDSTKKASPAYVRTARHLYDLSNFQTAGYNYAVKGLYFEQELDIDYSDYTVGYDSEFLGKFKYTETGNYKQQPPIGTSHDGKAFTGTYDGKDHMIKNVFFNPTGMDVGTDLGLFGTTASDSTLTNIVYDLNLKDEPVTKSGANVGALVGKNQGAVDNCAVFGVSMTATAGSVGGLAGQNSGTITNCAAEVASMTATSTNAGGLVGSNPSGKTVSSSYAVGRIKATGNGTIAGLVGSNSGKVETSYAAVDVIGNHAQRYGLCNGGTVTDSGWIEDAFVYRGVKFNTDAVTLDLDGPGTKRYNDDSLAVSFKGTNGLVTKLTGSQKTVAAGNTIRNIPDSAFYESTYSGKDFPYLTGVKTTLKRNSDTGSIDPEQEGTNEASIHYGLWPLPLPIWLSYYEQYSTNDYGMDGYFEDKQIANLSDDHMITKDGYALVFEGENKDVPYGNYEVVYGKGGSDTSATQKWTLTKSGTNYTWKNQNLTQEVTPIQITQGTTYTLIPLPDKVNTEKLADKSTFYQKVVCGKGMFDERTYYFNPHFAGTGDMRPLTSELEQQLKAEAAAKIRAKKKASLKDQLQKDNPDLSNNALDEQAEKEVAKCADEIDGRAQEMIDDLNSQLDSLLKQVPEMQAVAVESKEPVELKLKKITVTDKEEKDCSVYFNPFTVRVRTARHLYDLSRFQDARESLVYATQGYYFLQNLNLDYDTYDWYGSASSLKETGIARQDPIGLDKDSKSFQGTYDGGNHTIRNVLYNTDRGEYIGLFGHASGLLTKIDYLADYGDEGQSVTKQSGNACMGLLAGYAATITDSAIRVNGKQTIKSNGGGSVYGGGMAGQATRMERCKAEVYGTLSLEGSGMYTYGGGLAAYVESMTDCTAYVEGDLTVKGTRFANITYGGGLVGFVNQPNIIVENCHATMTGTLTVTATGTGANAYGGGLAGYAVRYGGTVRDSEATIGALFIEQNATDSANEVYGGGLVGRADEGNFENCHATIKRTLKVIGNRRLVYAGGLVGLATDLTNCDATVIESLTITGTADYAQTEVHGGGLAGRSYGKAENCSVNIGTLSVEGKAENTYGGGLAGDTGSLTGCTSTTQVKEVIVIGNGNGNTYGGGLVGSANSLDSCSTIKVERVTVNGTGGGNAYGGGLVGQTTKNVEKCDDVTIGPLSVTGNGKLVYGGGLVGHANKLEYCSGFKATNVTVKGTGNGDAYGGGLVGKTSDNVEDCSKITVTGRVTVEGTGSGPIYGGGLVGSVGFLERCSEITVTDLTVRRTKDGDAYGGGLAGETVWGARSCGVTVGTLTINGTGGVTYAGGLVGIQKRTNPGNVDVVGSSVTANTIDVTGNGDTTYAGGLVGWAAYNVNDCSAGIASMSINGAGNTYGGGVAGYVGNYMERCGAAATITVDGSGNAYVGGLVGETAWGASSCYAVGKISSSNSSAKIAGLIGKVTPQIYNSSSPNSYAAVAVSGSAAQKSDFCGDCLNIVNFANCCYLDGTWTYNGEDCSALGTNNPSGVTGVTYDQLAGRTISDMGKVPTDPEKATYPFPVSTKKDGSWYYPGSDWPKSSAAAVQAQSEPTALLPPDALPVEPVLRSEDESEP